MGTDVVKEVLVMAKAASSRSKQVITWGLPWGVAMAVIWWGREYGWSLSALKSLGFAMGVLVWLAGGLVFGVVSEWCWRALWGRFRRG